MTKYETLKEIMGLDVIKNNEDYVKALAPMLKMEEGAERKKAEKRARNEELRKAVIEILTAHVREPLTRDEIFDELQIDVEGYSVNNVSYVLREPIAKGTVKKDKKDEYTAYMIEA